MLTLLVGPIKSALSVSDAAMGLLMGPMFALVYLFAGLPFGWLADRVNRRNIIVIAVGFWSLMTALSGFARRVPAAGAVPVRHRLRRGGAQSGGDLDHR